MSRYLRLLPALGLFAALALPSQASSIHGYQFYGQCTDCWNGGLAYASLIVNTSAVGGYTGHLVEFSYGGTDLYPAFTITQENVAFFEFHRITDTMAYMVVAAPVGGPYFSIDYNGTWFLRNSGGIVDADYGTQARLVPTPEPSTFALLGLAFSGLAAALHRRRAASPAAS
jgi:hypothetical protein